MDSPNGGGHLHEIIMFTMHACACVHACACAHVWGAPPNYPHPYLPTPLPPEPQGARNTKIQ